MVFPFNINNVDDFYSNSEFGPSGYYPIGTGSIWHSGIHVNYTGGDRIIKPLIPGGRVVAFRLGYDYQTCDLPEKITQESYTHEFSNYKDNYEDVHEEELNYYKLKENTDNKYSVSNNFILLKHEIENEALNRNLVFYSLYMNLAPLTESNNDSRVLHTKDKMFYPDFMCDSATKKVKRGFQCESSFKPQGINQIGKPGFLKGEWYYDFCVFLEDSLFNAKENESIKSKSLYHHFDKSVKVYIRSEVKQQNSRKFYWPNKTEADIDAYDDGFGKTIYKYTINKIRPIYETTTAKKDVDYEIKGGKITIKTLKGLWLSGKTIEETDFKLLADKLLNQSFDVLYVESKPAFFCDSSYFSPVTFWSISSDLNSGGTKEYQVFDSNPYIYSYAETSLENIPVDFIEEISTKEIETKNLEEKLVGLEFKQTQENKYFITVSDKQKCEKTVFSWNEWFYDLNIHELDKNDIVCDKTLVTEETIKKFNKENRIYEYTAQDMEKWWYGAVLQSIYLKGIFGKEDKYEFAKTMIAQFRKAMCKHPLEWDQTLFDNTKIEETYRNVTETNLHGNIKEKLINESKASDIWKDSLQTYFKHENEFFFVHPVYFLNHLDRAEVFGFNPYKTYNKTYKKDTDLGKEGNNDGDSLEEKILLGTEDKPLDNPGFAPLAAKGKSGSDYPVYEGITYAACTSPFNILRIKAGDHSKSLRHTGIDLAPGGENTEIISLIYGTVWDRYFDADYGNIMLIKNDNENLLYMLCHLQGFIAKKGAPVTPGQPVALTGQTGEWGGTGIHLHLEVREIESISSTGVYTYNSVTQKIVWDSYKLQVTVRRNAFNHSEKYRVD